MIREGWNIITECLFNLGYPRHCVCCKKAVFAKSDGLCDICWQGLEFIVDPSCDYCGQGIDFCICSKTKKSIEKFYCSLKYNKMAMMLISRFKYKKCKNLAPFLANLVLQRVRPAMKEVDIWIPIPLHKDRLKTREYNQSAILLMAMQKAFEGRIFCHTNVVQRVVNNKQQAALTKAERLVNVQDIFVINSKYRDVIQGRSVAILDDVITTGATIQECAKTLLDCGARKVFGVSLAKT